MASNFSISMFMYLYVTFSGSFHRNIGLLSKLILFANVTSLVRFEFDKFFFFFGLSDKF